MLTKGTWLAVLIVSADASAQLHVSAAVPADPAAPVPAPPTGDQTDAVVAATRSGFLLAWTDQRGSATWPDIYATRLALDGGVLDPQGVLVAGGAYGQQNPGLACLAGVCLLAFHDSIAGVVARPLDESGAPLGPDVVLDPGATRTYGVAVAAGADDFAVAWSNASTQIRAARVAPDGGVTVSFAVPASASDRFPWVAYNGRDALVVWEHEERLPDAGPYSQVRGVIMSGTGQSSVLPLSPRGAPNKPQVHALDGGWAVSWVETTYSYGAPLVQRVASDGSAQGVPLLVDAGLLVGQWSALASDGDRLRLVCSPDVSPAQLATFTVEANGAQSQAPFQTLVPGARVVEYQPRIAFGADAGAVVWTRGVFGIDVDVVAAAVDPGMNRLTGDLTVQLIDNAQSTPALSYGDSVLTAVWVDNRYALDGGRAQLFAVRLDGAGSPLEAPSRVLGRGPVELAPVALFAGGRTVVVSGSSPVGYVGVLDVSWLDGAPPASSSITVTSGMGAATLVDTDDSVWLLYPSYGTTGSQSLGMRFAYDGGLLRPATALLPEPTYYVAGAWAREAGVLMIGSISALGVRVSRFTSDGTALDDVCVPRPVFESAYYPVNLEMATDGRDVLLAWNGTTDMGRGVVVDSMTGTAKTPVLDIGAYSGVTPISGSRQVRPRLAFDGRSYVAVYEQVSRDGGTDLYARRVGTDGALGPEQLIAAGPLEQEQPALAVLGPGRLALAYRDARASGGPRVMVRFLREVLDGDPCSSASDCVFGACVSGICCAPDAGVCTARDAGTPTRGVPVPRVACPPGSDGGGFGADGGSGADAGLSSESGPGPRKLSVGCSCQGASNGLVALALLAVVLRRRRRSVAAPR